MTARLESERQCGSPAGKAAGQELPGGGSLLLPLGLFDADGRAHRDAVLRPITGHEQRSMAELSPQAPMAEVMTALLSSCLQAVGTLPLAGASLARALLPGDREFLLLKLFEMTFGERLYVTLRCPAETCHAQLELPVSTGDFAIEASPPPSRTFLFTPQGGTEGQLEFRLPTGGDQETVCRYHDLSEEERCERMLAECLEDQPREAAHHIIASLSSGEREHVERRMHELAPQLEIALEAVCPDCGAAFNAEIDLPFLLLTQMRADEPNLDWEVHFLAWHYHWSEAEILALTPTRRRRYIGLLQEELENMGAS